MYTILTHVNDDAKIMVWEKLKHGQSSNWQNVHSECCTHKSEICGCYCSAATHSPIVHTL